MVFFPLLLFIDYGSDTPLNNDFISNNSFIVSIVNDGITIKGFSIKLYDINMMVIQEHDTVILGKGGTVKKSANYVYHVFETNGIFETEKSVTVDAIVVGGGGGGGKGGVNTAWPCYQGAGGGGAGGLNIVSGIIVNGVNNVIVGSGGTGATLSSKNGINGGISSFSTISVSGGGGGGSYGIKTGSKGGSGGGGASGGVTGGGNSGSHLGGAGTGTEGKSGGGGNRDCGGAGAGGGYNEVGGGAVSGRGGGKGGNGYNASIWMDGIVIGNNMFAAGGGGGGTKYGSSIGNGGNGGSQIGGSGGNSNTAPNNAVDNTGSGGGGGVDTRNGGNGSNGIVIIRYPIVLDNIYTMFTELNLTTYFFDASVTDQNGIKYTLEKRKVSIGSINSIIHNNNKVFGILVFLSLFIV